jgi:hypothetical protein
VDTDLAFSEFFTANHTVSLRYMPHFARGYEGPCVAENGQGTFVLGQGEYFKNKPDESKSSPRLYVAVGSQSAVFDAAIESERWHHLALVSQIVQDGRLFTLFLDGASVGTLGVPNTATGLPAGTLRFGKRTSGKVVNERNAQFYGLLADVGIFTRALSTAEVAALAAPGKGFTGSETGLLAAYPLTSASAAPKLSRPVTLHGPARIVAASAGGDNLADAKLLPMPAIQQPMDLPFPLGEAWVTGQAWNAKGTHRGLAAFCWDLTAADKSTSGAPVHASAPGEVAAVRESAPSGDGEYANHIDVKQAENEFASYIHVQQNSVPVAKGGHVTLGQKVALAGDSGTGVGNFHLHFAVSDKPDQTGGFITIPVAFSDYEQRLADGSWKAVARGVPKTGDVIRNPATPAFASRSIGPDSAVSRGGNLLDLVASDVDGGVWIARWTPNRYVNNWDRWRRVLADIGSTRPIGVVSRSASRLDIVTANASGAIYTGGWHEPSNNGVWGGWWRIRDHVAKGNAPVTVVARDSGKLDVFSVRNDGAVSTAAWDHGVADGAWRGWWSVAGGTTVPGGWVTAVSRAPNKLDVFMVGNDGGVYTAAWEHGVAGGAWRGWWRVRDMIAVPGSYVAAVARDPEKLDIFAVRTDGAISTAAWDRQVANGAWRGWWSVAGGQAAPAAPVTVVSRHPNKLDVFVVGRSGGVFTAAWEHGVASGAWRGWWRIRDLVAFPASAVAAVARDPNKLDVFAVRNDGQMSTAAWDHAVADGAWRGWWRIGS